MSTKVLFPRFETEMIDPAVEERALMQRAELRPWISDEQVEVLTHPATDTNVDWSNRHSSNPNWWGVYCTSLEVVPYGQLFESSFSRGDNKLFRSRLLHHDYLWDDQAMAGSADEIVLEQLSANRPAFKELMALLIPGSNRQLGQRLVMADRCGRWKEPKFRKRSPKRQFYLEVLSQLAMRHSMSDEVIHVAL